MKSWPIVLLIIYTVSLPAICEENIFKITCSAKNENGSDLNNSYIVNVKEASLEKIGEGGAPKSITKQGNKYYYVPKYGDADSKFYILRIEEFTEQTISYAHVDNKDRILTVTSISRIDGTYFSEPFFSRDPTELSEFTYRGTCKKSPTPTKLF